MRRIKFWGNLETSGSPNPGQKTRPRDNLLSLSLSLSLSPLSHTYTHKKNNLLSCWLCHSSGAQSENKKAKRLIIGPCQRTKQNCWTCRWPIKIVVRAVGVVPKSLEKRLKELKVKGRIKTIQTTELLRSARTLRIVLDTWRDLQSLIFQWKTIS